MAYPGSVLGGVIRLFPCSGAGQPCPGRSTPLLQALGDETPLPAHPALKPFPYPHSRASITRVPFYDLVSARKKKIASKQ